MRPVSESTARIVKQSFSRKYIALGRIVNNWDDIVGDKFADKAQPVKINYRKNKRDKTGRPEATLDIAVSSAHATVLHYQKDVILERINQIFGEPLIKGIRFVNVASNSMARPLKKSKPQMSSAQEETLADMVASIADDDIKERLSRLGCEILTTE